MARRVVTYTLRDDEGDILYVCQPNAEWSPCPIEEAIADIEHGVHTYVVEIPDGPDTDIHVVEHPGGKYLRTVHDGVGNNNLDNLDSRAKSSLPVYIGNYPDGRFSTWSDDLQGVTHSSSHWFFTQMTKLYKFHVSTDLDTNANSAVTIAHMPSELSDLDCNHFGDPDYLEVNGQGYVFVPVEGSENDCGDEPRLAVFRDDAQLTYIGASRLPRQNSQRHSGRAGWCAFSPIDHLLYSSSNQITKSLPVFRYRVDFAALEQGHVVLHPESDLILHDAGSPVNIPQYIQGGCFSPDGTLFICNGRTGDDERGGGIRAFLPSGELLYRSSTTRKPFKYEYHSGFPTYEEPEGITYWDVDSLPAGMAPPHIEGQLHTILLNNDVTDTDDIYFKHYRIS